MQKKENINEAIHQHDTLRYKLIKLLSVNVNTNMPYLTSLEIAFEVFNYIQLLKFSIDYYSNIWFDDYVPIFLHLDLAYYSRYLNQDQFNKLLIIIIGIMNAYWSILVVLLFVKPDFSPKMAFFRKATFLIARHILLLPFLSLLLGMYSCYSNTVFRQCYKSIPILLQIVYITSFLLFSCFIAGQTFLNFEFLARPKQYTRLKTASFIPITFFIYFILSEIAIFGLGSSAQLVFMNVFTLMELGLVWWKDQQIEQQAKLIEFSGLGATVLGIVIIDMMILFNLHVALWVYILLIVLLTSGIMQIKTYSLKFQLQNINKWPTPDIMMRYASTIRYYLSRGSEYIFKIYIHGYMEIHRQKCDNIACPSRCALTESDHITLQTMGKVKENEQLVRINNIMKVIYGAGYRLNPISAHLQLQNCVYLYERGNVEIALRNLLQIKYEQLSFDKYYCYCYLKQILQDKIVSSQSQNFLDLVTQMNLSKKEEEIIKLFEKVALQNLEFWSLLNDDHPDFQKLTEVGIKRMRLGQQIQKQFQIISKWAHSQRVVTLYANYLQCLQNDENILMDIYKDLTIRYKLQDKVLVQNWNNSSTYTMLISLDQTSYGKILDLNTSCAVVFGYGKNELINQTIKILWPDQLNSHIRQFLSQQSDQQHFFLTHKSGYLIHFKKNTKNYNSMQSGLTALINLIPQLSPFSCFIIFDKNNKIIASTPSIISLLKIDLKSIQGETNISTFFNFSFNTLSNFSQDETYSLHDLLKSDCLPQGKQSNQIFKIHYEQRYACKFVQLRKITRNLHLREPPKKANLFEFQVQSSLSNFKYAGSNSGGKNSFIPEFSIIQINNLLEQQQKEIKYGSDILTLRLRENVVQMIQDEAEGEDYIQKENSQARLLEIIPKQDQQSIFQSKHSYKQFFKNYRIASNVFWMLGVGFAFVIVLYIIQFAVGNNNSNSTIDFASEIINQNLIIGAIAKQSAYIVQMKLLANNQSLDNPSRLITSYNDNLDYLQQIQLLGSAPFQITFPIAQEVQTYQTSQYISTVINYATALSNKLANIQTIDLFKSTFNSIDNYTISYLLSGQTVKDILLHQFSTRKVNISNSLNNHKTIQAVLISIGIILTVLMGGVVVCWFHQLSKQKIKVLQIFLQITEIHLQHFSTITERFLLSIHSSQTSQMEDEFQNSKKTVSSSFAKKKSFKIIQLDKALYIKLAFVPALMTAYFFHNFAVSSTYINFQSIAIDYLSITAQADYYLATTSLQLSKNLIANSSIQPFQATSSIRLYYRSFLDEDQLSFGLIRNYHLTTNAILFQDICNGSDTPYGFVSLPDSCNLSQQLYPYGTYLVIDSLLKQISFWSPPNLFSLNYHKKMFILTQAQRMISQKLMIAERQISDDVKGLLMEVLLIWLGVVIICGGTIWIVVVSKFLNQLNQVKSILGILPLSVAKEIPLVSRYINYILKKKDSC